ncbi:hypothetical protein [Corynebacterium glucuronolyticum]
MAPLPAWVAFTPPTSAQASPGATCHTVARYEERRDLTEGW